MPAGKRKAPGSGDREVRSNYEAPSAAYLSPATDPCRAPAGHYWIHAFPENSNVTIDAERVGKWLIHLGCQQVSHCWSRVREATEHGRLGISAKVATDWGTDNDPAGPFKSQHVVCVFTRDYRDRADVLRVAKELRVVDAVRRQVLQYKPDLMTLSGFFSGNTPGSIAIYECAPSYTELSPREDAFELLRQLESRRGADRE